ncbi:MAG: RpoL/Rpb11 RNA polymerase subunit family protein [Candidatus Micrarchaeaceae archaeon]
MEMTVIEDESGSFVAEVTGMDRGILELVKDKLLSNKSVDFASVVKEHPESAATRLVVKAARNPKGLVAKAVEEVEEDIKEFQNEIKGKLK